MKYYTDPLQAALMARDYGVRLISRGGAELHNFGLGMGAKTKLLGIVYHQPPYYVTPDSEHIFQHQDGDESRGGWVFSADIQAWRKCACDKYSEVKRPHELPINLRQGRAFFMPDG
jgi:hypothetical protein